MLDDYHITSNQTTTSSGPINNQTIKSIQIQKGKYKDLI